MQAISLRSAASGESHRHSYSHVCHNSSQSAVYDATAKAVVEGVVAGVNGTVMAYGQTGSGKTFTIVGDPLSYRNRGIAPRAITQIFSSIAARPELDVEVSVSYLEIYNERIADLLERSKWAESMRLPGEKASASGGVGTTLTDYAVIDDPVSGVAVRGLTCVPITSEEQALNALFAGETARTTAAHSLNRNSNRSHCIFTIHLRQRTRLGGGREKIIISKLHLVDLAGSERLKKTLMPVEGTPSSAASDTLLTKESMFINRSLSFLEQCVVALSRASAAAAAASSGAVVKPVHIPYRQSKLTSVLKDSLGGNCATVFIACVWGEARHMEETTSTLRLAARMMSVHNSVGEGGVAYDTTALLHKYERQINQLQQELAMHDALTERTGIVYGDYTPEQQAAINAKLRAYLASSEGDASEMRIESVAHMREVLAQSRALFKSMAVEVEEQLRERFILVPKDGSGGGAGDAALRAVVPSVGSGGEALPRPDSRSQAAKPKGSSAGSGGVGAGSAQATLPSLPTTTASAASSVYGTSGSGELDTGVSGFALGLAPSHARPSNMSPTRSPTATSSSVAGTPTGSPARLAASGQSLLDAFGHSSLPGSGSGRSMSPSRDEVNELWRRYRSVESGGPGAAAAASIGIHKAKLHGLREAVNACALAVNAAKTRIDTLAATQQQQQGAGSEDARASLAKSLVEAKTAYRSQHSRLQSTREELSAVVATVDRLTAELIDSFERWAQHGGSGGSGLMGRERGMLLGTLSPRVGGGEDVLDEAEAFERLERERVAAIDPDSLAFFSATRGLRQGTQVSIPHKRGGIPAGVGARTTKW